MNEHNHNFFELKSKGSEFSWNDFEITEENKMNFERLRQCLEKRQIYQRISLQNDDIPKMNNQYNEFKFENTGVYSLHNGQEFVTFCPSISEFYKDSEFIIGVCSHRPTRSLCFRRLQNLKHNFLMYKNLCEEREKLEQKTFSRKDFYNVVKIDTHIHHSAAMNSKHLLNFIKSKLIDNPKDVVYQYEDKSMTLEEVFSSLGISRDRLCIDSLDTHAHTDTFHRFDRFNAKYNPYGQPLLRDIFLKYDNYSGGKYLAELTSELFSQYSESKYIYAEYRISIYGKGASEWNLLAKWGIQNKLHSKHVRWLIQIPRLFSVLLKSEKVTSFGDMLQNIFEPLFAVTQDPLVDPVLAKFLEDVVGFDCVDDESLKEKRYHKKFPPPGAWLHKENPPYSYYMYFLYANITMLNHFRVSKGLKPFSFRPHSGETGDWEHLAYTFLTAQSINHGVQLRKVHPLQYLYYLARIGISMSPLSNNSLFLSIENNPFPDFFKCGLNVCLSTDDPLQFHFTKEPLMEEYSVASQIWKLNSADQCELARNSVLQSNFSFDDKLIWLGDGFQNQFTNNIEFSNIPNIRVHFRKMMYNQEYNLIMATTEFIHKDSYSKSFS